MTRAPRSLQRRVVVSTSSQVISQIVVSLLGVITLKLITNDLGKDGYGVYATVLAFVSTFSLLTDLGLNAVNAREIAKRPDEAEDILSHNIGLRIALCVVMVPAIYGLSFVFYPQASHELRGGILLLSGFLVFDAVRSVGLSYFGSQVRGHITAVINGVQQLLITGLVIAAIFGHLGFFGFIAAYIIANTMSMILTIVLVRREVLTRPKINLRKWKTIITMSISLGVIQLINMMYLKVDSIMLSVIKGTGQVGIYSIAYSLVAAFMVLPSFIMTALIPSLATADSNGVTVLVQKAYDYMVIFACLLAAGSLLVRKELVVAISSGNFALAATPFAILGIASAFSYISSVFGFASVSLNKHHKLIYISGAALILNIALNIVLIPKLSYNGAAFATLVTEVAAMTGIISVFKRETGIRIHMLPSLIKPVVASLATVVLVTTIHGSLGYMNVYADLGTISFVVLFVYVTSLWIMRGIPRELINSLKYRLSKEMPHD